MTYFGARASGASGLCARDRADFDRVLHRALDTVGLRTALRADPTGKAATRLRTWAWEAAEEISAAADAEYRAYGAARDAARERFPAVDATVAPLLLVLAHLISALAGGVLLLIGYGLRLAGVAVELGASVVSAGWVLAAIAGVTAVVSLCALLRAMASGGGEPADGRRPVGGADVRRAQERWQQALLERGVLPYVRRRLPDALAP